MEGIWMKTKVGNYYKCSNCGHFVLFPTHNKYCSNCGLKMLASEAATEEPASSKMVGCRHCGGQGRILKGEKGYYVECSDCHCKTAEFDTPEEGI